MPIINMSKGTMDDILYLIIAITILGFTLLVIGTAAFKFNEKWQNQTEIPQISKDAVNQVITSGYDTLFNLFPFVFVFFFLISLILASYVETNPAIAFLGVILLGILVVVSSAIGTVFIDVASNTNFSIVTSRYPVMNFIFQNFASIICVMGGLMLIVLYAKWPDRQRSG
jgi:hypothetical protein